MKNQCIISNLSSTSDTKMHIYKDEKINKLNAFQNPCIDVKFIAYTLIAICRNEFIKTRKRQNCFLLLEKMTTIHKKT